MTLIAGMISGDLYQGGTTLDMAHNAVLKSFFRM